MKITDIKAIPFRVKLLITWKTTWVDTNTGVETTTKEPFSMVWAIAGIHSYKWWWVRRYGRLPCGCTRNPLTRRIVLYNFSCSHHGSFHIEGLEGHEHT